MLHALLQRERVVVLTGLLVVILFAWGWLFLGAGIEMEQMDRGSGQIMLMAPHWSTGYAVVIFLMWAIMMMAMMLPSAAPAILLAAALMAQRGGSRMFGSTDCSSSVTCWSGSASVWSPQFRNSSSIGPSCCRPTWPVPMPRWLVCC